MALIRLLFKGHKYSINAHNLSPSRSFVPTSHAVIAAHRKTTSHFRVLAHCEPQTVHTTESARTIVQINAQHDISQFSLSWSKPGIMCIMYLIFRWSSSASSLANSGNIAHPLWDSSWRTDEGHIVVHQQQQQIDFWWRYLDSFAWWGFTGTLLSRCMDMKSDIVRETQQQATNTSLSMD